MINWLTCINFGLYWGRFFIFVFFIIMESKFVKKFAKPRLVVCKKNLKSYGFCLGARKFSNGSFALLNGDGIVLYDSFGRLMENHLSDVYVFANGAVLKRVSVSPADKFCWCLEIPGIQIPAMQAEVLGDAFVALKFAARRWKVLHFTEKQPQNQIFSQFDVDDVKIFNGGNVDSVVFALTCDGKTELQLFWVNTGKVIKRVDYGKYFSPLPCGCFELSDNELHPVVNEPDLFFAEDVSGGMVKVFDARLRLKHEAVSGVAMFANGFYLCKIDGRWMLYSPDGRLLYSDIQNLHACDAGLVSSSLLFGDTIIGKHAVIRQVVNGWLHVSVNGTGFFCLPDGTKVSADDGTVIPFLI